MGSWEYSKAKQNECKHRKVKIKLSKYCGHCFHTQLLIFITSKGFGFLIILPFFFFLEARRTHKVSLCGLGF